MSQWICAQEKPEECRFYHFTKTCELPETAHLTAHLCGDARYQFYVNDQLVSEGPCQGSSYVTYYETVDLTPYLKAGKNTFNAKVLFVTDDIFISVYRHAHPGFWMDGTLTVDGTETPFGTDTSWACEREDHVHFLRGPGVHASIPPFEDMAGAPVLTPVPVFALYEPNLEDQGFNMWGLQMPYALKPRLIPAMETKPKRAMKELRRGPAFIELDAEMYTTAKITFRFKAKAGTRVRLIYSESYMVQDESGNYCKRVRDDFHQESSMLPGVFDWMTATGEEQVFSPFWFRSFRFIRIEFEEDADFSCEELSYSPYFYPLDEAGHFTCSDANFNRMWEISRNTVLCCMHEMYVDCPFYEQQQYDMDSALEMLFTFRMSADDRMPFKSLTDLGQSQMDNGMLQANYPSTSVQLITGFTLYWVLMVRDYLRYTGCSEKKVARVRRLNGTINKALEYFDSLVNEDGLVGPTPFWPFVDWVPSWHIGVPEGGTKEPITATCLLYVAALRAAAEICDATDRPGMASDYRVRADRMVKAVNANCYDAKVGLYRDTPSRELYSQHTAIWAILSEAVTGEAAGQLIDRTFHAEVPTAKSCFSMNHYLFRALEKADRYELASGLLDGWQKMLDWHCTTWCENPDSPRSECHGWSSAPIYEFSAMVLGVYPTENGFTSVRIQPYTDGFGLTWAEGTVPTPFGVIAVSWKKENGQFTLSVTLPDGAPMQAEIILPDGSTHELHSGHADYVLTC